MQRAPRAGAALLRAVERVVARREGAIGQHEHVAHEAPRARVDDLERDRLEWHRACAAEDEVPRAEGDVEYAGLVLVAEVARAGRDDDPLAKGGAELEAPLGVGRRFDLARPVRTTEDARGDLAPREWSALLVDDAPAGRELQRWRLDDDEVELGALTCDERQLVRRDNRLVEQREPVTPRGEPRGARFAEDLRARRRGRERAGRQRHGRGLEAQLQRRLRVGPMPDVDDADARG